MSDSTHHHILTTFPLFSYLPPNIRHRILSHAAPAPRTRFIELYDYCSPKYTPKIRYIPALPPLFSTTRETRAFSIAHEGGSLAHFFETAPLSKHFYIHSARDVVFLSSRFSPGATSTETGRLSELSSLLNRGFLVRVRRVVVTYSGRDEFERVGEVLVRFKGLETLYVAMYDRWSEPRVRRARPPVGDVGRKIKVEVDEAEEEESARGGPVSGRGLRVLECQLRLDE